jgi:hypothetical protein
LTATTATFKQGAAKIDISGDIFCELRHIVTKYGFLEMP